MVNNKSLPMAPNIIWNVSYKISEPPVVIYWCLMISHVTITQNGSVSLVSTAQGPEHNCVLYDEI